MKRAVEGLAALLAEHGGSEEEVVRELRARGTRTQAAGPGCPHHGAGSAGMDIVCLCCLNYGFGNYGNIII